MFDFISREVKLYFHESASSATLCQRTLSGSQTTISVESKNELIVAVYGRVLVNIGRKAKDE